jgi:FtsH-binding integral membrane protein
MKKALTFAVIYTLPLVAFAQTPNNLTGLISFAGDILNRIIPVLIALALVVFFWGLVMYIVKKKPGEARGVMIAGLLGLFVMVSVWGIIRLAQNTFGVGNAAPVGIPQVPQR